VADRLTTIHAQFDRQKFCTCVGQLHCPRLFAATQKPEIKAAPQQHSTERTCQVITPLSPIEAAARDAVTRRFQRVDFDAELIGKPLCARRRDREPLNRSGLSFWRFDIVRGASRGSPKVASPSSTAP
jgi:hypothetical protein